MSDMRRWMMLCEAKARPSQALLTVVEQWINGWSAEERPSAEAALWAIKDEAKRFVARRYGKLYRGMAVTDSDNEALRAGRPIELAMPRLASWSKHRDIALDYAEGVIPGILVAKTNLMPVLDVTRILSFLPTDLDADGYQPDYIRWAYREGEVVCEHDSPMLIAPSEAELFRSIYDDQ